MRYAHLAQLYPARYEGMTDDGLPIYRVYSMVTDPDADLFETDDTRSRWRMRFGVRWSF